MDSPFQGDQVQILWTRGQVQQYMDWAAGIPHTLNFVPYVKELLEQKEHNKAPLQIYSHNYLQLYFQGNPDIGKSDTGGHSF